MLPMINIMITTSMEGLKEIDVAKYVETPDAAVECYDNASYVEEMHQLLPSLLREGYLD